MVAYLMPVLGFFGLSLLAMFVLFFIGAWTEGPGILVFMLGGAAIFLWSVVRTVIWSTRGFRLFCGQNPWWRSGVPTLAAVLLLILSVLLYRPIAQAAIFSSAHTELWLKREHYEAIIAKIQSRKLTEPAATDNGVNYFVAREAPLIVYFGHGPFGNLYVIVRDPGGDMTSGGGLFYGCVHLDSDFYSCARDL